LLRGVAHEVVELSYLVGLSGTLPEQIASSIRPSSSEADREALPGARELQQAFSHAEFLVHPGGDAMVMEAAR